MHIHIFRYISNTMRISVSSIILVLIISSTTSFPTQVSGFGVCVKPSTIFISSTFTTTSKSSSLSTCNDIQNSRCGLIRLAQSTTSDSTNDSNHNNHSDVLNENTTDESNNNVNHNSNDSGSDSNSVVQLEDAANNHNLGFSILEQEMDNVEIINDFRPKLQQQQQTSSDQQSSSNVHTPPFVKMFRGSANYISYHRGSTIVLHIPVSLINIHSDTYKMDSSRPSIYYENLLDDVATLWLLGIKIVIILGCRELLDERLNADLAAVEPVTHKGIRVTDAKLLRYLKEEAGNARFEVERQLARALRQKQNTNTPQSGGNVVSGNFFSAQPVGVRDGIDFVYTGLLRKVEVDKIQKAHVNNDVVILTSLGVSPSGELFSVKSESLAAGVASKLNANKIIYLLKEPCHIREIETQNAIMSLRLADAKRLLTNFGITVNDTTGEYVSSNVKYSHPSAIEFLERIGFCSNALNAGVRRAHLVCPSDGSLIEELFTIDNGSATMISRDLYDGIRRATVNDVVGITKLIQPLIDSGTIVERSTATLENEIQTFYVYTRDEVVIACGQLKRYEGGYAEIGCLAVQSDYR